MIKTIYSNTYRFPRSGIYCPFNFEKAMQIADRIISRGFQSMLRKYKEKSEIRAFE